MATNMFEPSDLVTVKEFGWTPDYSYHRTLTCIKHQECRWTTKNPYDRTVFYVSAPIAECECVPVENWRVVVSLSGNPRR